MKEFYSNKKKIVPQLSDDWNISIQDNGKVTLISESLNQKIVNIPAINILSFIKENNISVIDGHMDFIFSIIKGKELVTIQDFNKERELFRKEQYLHYDTLKAGYPYIDEKGKEFIYLGYRYVSTIKEHKDGEFKYTNIAKKHFKLHFTYMGESKGRKFIFHFSPQPLTKKVVSSAEETYIGNKTGEKEELLSKTISEERINDIFTNMYNKNCKYVYFDKKYNYNPKYVLKEIQNNNLRKNEFLFAETQYGLVSYSSTEFNSILKYKKRGLTLPLHRTFLESIKASKYNKETLEEIEEISLNKQTLSFSSRYDRVEIYKKYRIGVE